MNKFLEEAKNSFFKREYKNALMKYSLALEKSPNDKEAKIGALLADMALENEDEAVALFEYYEVTKSYDKSGAENLIESIIESINMQQSNSFELVSTIDNRFDMFVDCITYEEFLEFVKYRDSFKTALEDVMFNLKIVIYKKEDFIDFIERLLENDCLQLAFHYLELSLLLYPNESFFKKIFNQIEDQKSLENKNRSN